MPEEPQTQVRAAWLYYMEGLTQAEIADRLKMTRLRVNRLLVEARSSGLVNITINSRLESCVRLERALIGRFGLKGAVVVPSPADPEQISAQIGKAAGSSSRGSSKKSRPASSVSAGAEPSGRPSAISAPGSIAISR